MRYGVACGLAALVTMPLLAQERVDTAFIAKMKQGSVVVATVLYHAAMRDGKFPRQ